MKATIINRDCQNVAEQFRAHAIVRLDNQHFQLLTGWFTKETDARHALEVLLSQPKVWSVYGQPFDLEKFEEATF